MISVRNWKGESMAERFQQFLGSTPGLVVELLDDTGSPYRVRTEDGFEFFVTADDFRDYYRKEHAATPQRWNHLVTDPQTGLIDCQRMADVMSTIALFVDAFQDYDKARAFARDAIRTSREHPGTDLAVLRKELETQGWDTTLTQDKDLRDLVDGREAIQELLLNDTCAVLDLPYVSLAGDNGALKAGCPISTAETGNAGERKDVPENAGPVSRRGGMKNVEMTVLGPVLTLTIDLSKEFGPSKSGKTIIVASTEGNKSVPGRTEKVGLNVYRQEAKKPGKGRKQSFKNVEMDVQGDMLKITVDVSKEFGPSKSGKTVIIASTEGNQLVYLREEKIGLNVYRKID
jgi:hypothetical protein